MCRGGDDEGREKDTGWEKSRTKERGKRVERGGVTCWGMKRDRNRGKGWGAEEGVLQVCLLYI